MKISLYGKLAELIGREVHIEQARCGTAGALRRALADDYRAAAEDLLSPRVKVFVGDTAVDDRHALCEHDDVSLLPPVSGG